MMIYELERPDIDCIIDCCEKLEAEEKLKVLYFGEKPILYYTSTKMWIIAEQPMSLIW